MAKLRAIACLHSKESVVPADSFWCSHCHFPSVSWFRLNNTCYLDWNRLQVVSTCLFKFNINRPSCFTIVSENPLFGECRARYNFVLVSDVLADESTLEQYSALLKNLLSFLSFLGQLLSVSKNLIINFSGFLIRKSRLVIRVTLELANKAVWGLVGFSDLKHGVLIV